MDVDIPIRGRDLKLRRIRAGIRQYRIAQELSIAPTILCEWENERRPIPPHQYARVREAIDRLAAVGIAGMADDAHV